MLVQLLYFPDCPNVNAARGALKQALSHVEGAPAVVEIDVTDAAAPADLRSWGSPTILVDGVDVAGSEPSGSCCRLYPQSGLRGVPSPALIEAALRRARQPPSP